VRKKRAKVRLRIRPLFSEFQKGPASRMKLMKNPFLACMKMLRIGLFQGW
jgi:hypothetical protein